MAIKDNTWNDSEWFESYVALRDVQAGQIIFWLDSLLDVAVDEKSTRAEQRAAQKAYDFAVVANMAYIELQAIMRPEVTEPEDDDDMAPEPDDLEPIAHMYPATCASSPAAEPVSEDSSVRAMAALKAEMVERYPSEMVPPLSAYISRVQLQRPDLGKTRCRSLAKMARDAGTRLEDMLVAKAAKRKPGRPRKVTKK